MSMQYLYLDSEVWNSLKTLLWRKCAWSFDKAKARLIRNYSYGWPLLDNK